MKHNIESGFKIEALQLVCCVKFDKTGGYTKKLVGRAYLLKFYCELKDT